MIDKTHFKAVRIYFFVHRRKTAPWPFQWAFAVARNGLEPPPYVTLKAIATADFG